MVLTIWAAQQEQVLKCAVFVPKAAFKIPKFALRSRTFQRSWQLLLYFKKASCLSPVEQSNVITFFIVRPHFSHPQAVNPSRRSEEFRIGPRPGDADETNGSVRAP